MNLRFIKTEIFALFFLIFVNLISTPAQIDSIYNLQAGTTLRLEMDNEINSRAASVKLLKVRVTPTAFGSSVVSVNVILSVPKKTRIAAA